MELGAKLGQGREAEVYRYGEGQVVKLFFAHTPLNVIEHEFKMASTIQDSELPMAKAYATVQVNGRGGIVYELLEGPTLLHVLLEDHSKAAWIGEISARLHARVHRCRKEHLPSQKEAYEKKIRAVKLDSGLKDKALRLLEQLPDSQEVCHGDFHPDNVLLTAQGAYVIDWINAKSGHRAADFVLSALMLKIAELPDHIPNAGQFHLARASLYKSYTQSYLKELPISKEEVIPWIPLAAIFRLEQGIGSEHYRLLKIIRRSLSHL